MGGGGEQGVGGDEVGGRWGRDPRADGGGVGNGGGFRWRPEH